MSRSTKALGGEVRMTINLGVTVIAKRAGEALSQARASGKNRAELA